MRAPPGKDDEDRLTDATERLDWRELPDRTYPVILGADVLYERRLVPLVVRLIARMLAPGGEALLAAPYRVAEEDLAPTLAQFGLTCYVTELEVHDQSGLTHSGRIRQIKHV